MKNVIVLLMSIGLSIVQGQPIESPCPPLKKIRIEAGIGVPHEYDNTTHYVRENQWVPLFVDIMSEQNPSGLEGIIRLNSGRASVSYSISLSTPAHSRKRITGYVYLEDRLSQMSLDVYEQGSLVQTFYPRLPFALGKQEEFVLVVTGTEAFRRLDHRSLKSLHYYTHPDRWARQVVWTFPSRLPTHRAGFFGYRAVVFDALSDAWKALLPSQIKALNDYVLGGGSLFLCGGDADLYLRDPKIGELSPVKPGLLKKTTIRWPGRDAPLENVSLRESHPLKGSRIICKTGDDPLLVSASKGIGQTYFVGVSLCDAGILRLPSDHSPGEPDFESQKSIASYLLHQTPPPLLADGAFDSKIGAQLHETIRDLTAVSIPSAEAIALFLTVYFLSIFLSAMAWKKIGRLPMAWLSTVAFSLFFCVVLYFLGQVSLPAPISVNSFSLVQTKAGSSIARADHYLSILSEKTGTYEIMGNDDTHWIYSSEFSKSDVASITRTSPVILQSSPPVKISQFLIYTRDVRNLFMQGILEIGHGIEARFKIEGNQVEGSLSNQTPYGLEHVFLVVGNQMASLGDIAPHRKKDIRSAIQEVKNFSPPAFDRKFSSTIASFIFSPQNKFFDLPLSVPYLMAFCKTSFYRLEGLSYHLSNHMTLLLVSLNDVACADYVLQKPRWQWHVFSSDGKSPTFFSDRHFTLKKQQGQCLVVYLPYPRELNSIQTKSRNQVKLFFSSVPAIKESHNLRLSGYDFRKKEWLEAEIRCEGPLFSISLYPAQDYICPFTARILVRCRLDSPKRVSDFGEIGLRPLELIVD